ncbi:MAG TPA: hypothetical protein PL070_18215, partial [Flavobacteriales bacterium]|nr:hypothetical protein [Flavobacteriales bacterium]
NYSVTIDDGEGCTGTASIFVAQSPDETPSVTVSGDPRGCEGQVVQLTSSSAAGYAWNNGAGNTQTVNVASSGEYAVTIQGVCGSFTSAPVVIALRDAPDAPIADDVTIPINTA